MDVYLMVDRPARFIASFLKPMRPCGHNNVKSRAMLALNQSRRRGDFLAILPGRKIHAVS